MKILLACLLADDGPSTVSTAILVGFVVVMSVGAFAVAIRSRAAKDIPEIAPAAVPLSKTLTFSERMDAIAAQHGAIWHYGSIAGVTRKNDDGSDRQRIVRELVPYQQLELVREPDNPGDKFAIAIFTADGRQIGYLPKRQAREVSGNMGMGIEYMAVVECIGQADTEEGPGPWGAKIALMRFDGTQREGDI